MTTLIPATVKIEELARLAREKAAYDALSYSERTEIETEKWIQQAKVWMAKEIDDAKSFPHKLRSGGLWDFRTEKLGPWLKEAGYLLELKWHSNGYTDEIDDIVITMAE